MNVEKYFDGTPEEVSRALLLVADMGAKAFTKRLETSLEDLRWACPLLSAPLTEDETRMRMIEATTTKSPSATMQDKIAWEWFRNEDPRQVLAWGMALAEWRHRTKVNKRWTLALHEEYIVTYSKRGGFRAFTIIASPCVRQNSRALWGWTPTALAAGRPPRCYGRPVAFASKGEADDVVKLGQSYLESIK